MKTSFQALKGKTVTDKTMRSSLVLDVINEQYGNLTGRHFKKDGSYQQVTSHLRAFARNVCRMAMTNSTPPTFELEWKDDFATQTQAILKTQGLDSYIKTCIEELKRRFPKHVTSSALVSYSFRKIAHHAGCVSRMILHGYHPGHLIMDEKESKEEMSKTASRFQKNGATVVFVTI